MHRKFLLLGGAGLVGLQVCRRILAEMDPERIVVASLLQDEAEAAVRTLASDAGSDVRLVPAWGNLFVPREFAYASRWETLSDPNTRRHLLRRLYGDFESAYEENHLVQMILEHRPDVIVDCVNTATGLSYQDVFDGAKKVMGWLDTTYNDDGVEDLEHFLLSQSVPQLIRHVRFVHRATTDAKTKVYLKVGTTGTGGMGLNIPYTHSEDKPSKVLLAKTEAAFGHTGLLFLLARTPGAPVVKEVKPAAMIGYRGVRTIGVTDRHGNAQIVDPHAVEVSGMQSLRDPTDTYVPCGELKLSVVDTGENGLFTRGEFAAITALGQMEYITPEEIARVVIHEIKGANTGRDVVSAIDSSVLNPTYKAGLVRSAAMHDLAQAEADSGLPSIALGRLGPPELSKLLFEAHLLKECFGTLSNVVGKPRRTGDDVAQAMSNVLATSHVRRLAPSIGIPILLPDGTTLLRGPTINVPEVVGHQVEVSFDNDSEVDAWARKGWVDLRAANAEIWLKRITQMIDTRIELRDAGSAAANIQTYLPSTFEIGEVVAWIFNNEMAGYRIK